MEEIGHGFGRPTVSPESIQDPLTSIPQ